MKMGNMCVLTIHNTQHTDGGKWVCHITSKSDFDENGKNIQSTWSKKENIFIDQTSRQVVDLQVLPHHSFGVISGQVK